MQRHRESEDMKKKPKKCQWCKGTGKELCECEKEYLKCRKCKGTGKVKANDSK